MYTKEQEELALKEFEKTGSVRTVIRKLGYPSISTLYRWYEHKKAGIENQHGSTDFNIIKKTQNGDISAYDKIPSAEFKYAIICRCFESGEDVIDVIYVVYVSREIGFSRQSIYTWRRKYLAQGTISFLTKAKRIPQKVIQSEKVSYYETTEIETFHLQIQKLQLEVDVLKETNILKKAVLIDALKNKYKLSALLAYLNMARSSYFYQRSVLKQTNKYAVLRLKIKNIFHLNRECYGYQRIYLFLKKKK